jgi:ribosome-associated protein
MWIIEDTRQQKSQHELKHDWFSKNQINLIRCKLPFGDYSLPPKVAVDTKKGLSEIANNICGAKAEHKRFKRECVLARDAGCKLIFLIENDEGISDINQVHLWKNPRTPFNPSCVQGDRLEKAMKTMSERYGCEFLFCNYTETGQKIMEILKDYEHDGSSN